MFCHGHRLSGRLGGAEKGAREAQALLSQDGRTIWQWQCRGGLEAVSSMWNGLIAKSES